ncbi:MAG: protease modulator HflC [Gammaproteobacteria bacterium]|nr:protease modulator HflC [Gammaproteobacteria bacterium]
MSVKSLFTGIFTVILLLVLSNSIYVINEYERGVLLRFGKVYQADLESGLHFKVPVMDKVRIFDGRVLTLDAAPERFFTFEKKVVIVDSFAKFRIDEVQKFYTATSGDEAVARRLLSQRINNGLRDEITARVLHEVVSGERDELMQILTKQVDAGAREELGIKVIDVRVKRIDLPPEVSQSVYDRMNAERNKEASQYRAEGEELAAGIRADADKQVEVLSAQAYAKAEELKGEGDADAAEIYASAYNRDKEFYKFYRSMSAYKNTFSNKGDILLIDPDSDFFTYLNKSKR